MTLRSRAYVVLLAAAMLGCSAWPFDPGDVNASIRFLNLEGGCWTLAVERTHYLPLNLPAEFKQDGLPVRVEFRERRDYGSVCQVGPVVEILSIHAR